MKLFDWFGRKAGKQPPQEAEEENSEEELAPYSGMRVEVTTPEAEGRLQIVAN